MAHLEGDPLALAGLQGGGAGIEAGLQGSRAMLQRPELGGLTFEGIILRQGLPGPLARGSVTAGAGEMRHLLEPGLGVLEILEVTLQPGDRGGARLLF